MVRNILHVQSGGYTIVGLLDMAEFDAGDVVNLKLMPKLYAFGQNGALDFTFLGGFGMARIDLRGIAHSYDPDASDPTYALEKM